MLACILSLIILFYSSLLARCLVSLLSFPLLPPPPPLSPHPFCPSRHGPLFKDSYNRLLESHIKPYFAQHKGELIQHNKRFQINEVDFKVVACHPQIGVTTEYTDFRVGPPISADAPIRKLHLLPMKATLNGVSYAPEQIFKDFVRPMFIGHEEDVHVMTGDAIVQNGVQFKVFAAQPSSGIVDRQTEIFTDGEPLPDITKMHILPFYESLPNREKDITPEQLFTKYLEPAFTGKMMYVTQGEEMDIDGVSFKVRTVAKLE